MTNIVLDTNILIDYVNGYAPWVENILSQKRETIQLILPTIVIAEYFTSIYLEDKKQVKVAEETFKLFKKQDLTEEIAKILGSILRRKSYIPSASLADLIVASTAIYLNTPLATRNKTHFSKIPNLSFFDAKKIVI